jgi:uncharacterized membrane protein
MESDQLYDDLQEAKTAFVIALLVSIYCFSVIRKSMAVHLEWKVICAGTGFSIVSAITLWLFVRVVKLHRAAKEALKDS